MFKKYVGNPATESLPAQPGVPSSLSPEPVYTPVAAPASTIGTPRPQTPSGRNVLSSDVEIKGTVKSKDDLVVDGKIEGTIASSGSLTIGENAVIKAEIQTATVVVYGKVHGNITASERVDLKAGSQVHGDIKAKVLSIEAGATFVGRSTAGPAAVAAAEKAANPSPAAATPNPSAPKPAASPQAANAPAKQEPPRQGSLPGTTL